MNPFVPLKRQVQYLFIALLLTCFAIPQSARAGIHERTIHIDAITSVLNCSPEEVRVGGRVLLRFGVKHDKSGYVVVPEHIELLDVSGKGLSTDRQYVPTETILRHRIFNVKVNEFGHTGYGTFGFRFRMIGRPNPPGTPDPNPEKAFDFEVHYEVFYNFYLSDVPKGSEPKGWVFYFRTLGPAFKCYL